MSGDRAPVVTALVLASALGGVAWTWRTGAVGGSDSACYALMARVFAEGQVQPSSALALAAPWPDPTRVAAPAGFLPSMLTPGKAVPVCAPGYSLLLAPLVRVAGLGVVHVVPPLAAAALAWLAFLLGRRLYSPWAGVGAAALVAVNPIVLFQAVQPMNDITTGALWLGAAAMAVAARPYGTGVFVGLGVLVRPNLAPAGGAAIAACAWIAARPFTAGSWPRAARTMLAAGASAAPSVLAALALNAALYGSPFQTGYGSLDALFAASHVPVNVMGYGRTWLLTASPLALLSLAAPWLVPRERREHAWALLLLAAALSVVYLAYRPFPEWWYLRFLLPAVALSLVLTSVAIFALSAGVAPGRGVPLAMVGVALALAWALRSPEAHEVQALQRLESRFPLTAEAVAARLPARAVAVTLWQSGGLRYWPGREVIVWDALDAAWLDRAVEWLAARGHPAAIVVERWEEEGFRQRFAGQVYGALDWPPRFDIDRRVRIFLPEDRTPYLTGAPVVTTPVFAPRR